ncbi:MAG TPA: hypothetical protein VFC23_12395, partial [Thermoanaerobaculia bacterium]|nr:hypothetical protein [Thermoanaerobaculia bacterium]
MILAQGLGRQGRQSGRRRDTRGTILRRAGFVEGGSLVRPTHSPATGFLLFAGTCLFHPPLQPGIAVTR